MNSVVLTKKGHVAFQRIPKPDPEDLKADQVLIKVEACTLNPTDILMMRGKYSIRMKYPFTPGSEGSGTVIKCGRGAGMMCKYLEG